MNSKMKKLKSSFELVGRLAARSHLLNTSPICAVLEVCTLTSVEYIIVDAVVFATFRGDLTIGNSYKFFNLQQSAIKLKTDTVKCFRASSHTTWIEENVTEFYCPPHMDDFTIVKGQVTRVDNEFGILYLDGSVPVIMSCCSRFALVPTNFKEGHKVHIFNVHRINLQNGTKIYVMCAKSYLSVVGEDTDLAAVPALNLSPLLLSLGAEFLDYRFVLWLQGVSLRLESALSDEFLGTFGVLLGDCRTFRMSLLMKIGECVLQRSSNDVRETSPLHEFMAFDHSLHCRSLVKVMIPDAFLTLNDINKNNPSLDVDPISEDPNVSWHYNIKNYSKSLIIGVVAMKNSSHRLTFTDTFGSVACEVLPQREQGSNRVPDFANLNRKVVLISQFDVIRESFAWMEDDKAHFQNYRSLAVRKDQFIVLSSFPRDNKNLKVDAARVISSAKGHAADMRVATRRHSHNFAEENCCISPLKDLRLKKYLSQFIFIQHKAAVCVPQQGKSARCYILATLLGEMVLHSDSNRGTKTSTSIFICLENSLLGTHPFISVNQTYEVRLPIGFNISFFKTGLPLSYVQGLKSLLPTVACVTLPNSAEIHGVNDKVAPCVSFKYGDFYRIDQILEENTSGEFVNVVGYIVQRVHQNPRFEREMRSIKANGFGTPGKTVISLVLCDTPPDNVFGSPVTLYLSYWVTLQYPMCLVPGVKVIVRFVTKVKSSTGAPYLRSSVLTSIGVLDLPKNDSCECDNSMLEFWGPRSLLCSVLMDGSRGLRWISVSMADLTRVSLSVTCSFCNYPFQNGSCAYVGCSATGSSKFFSQASFVIYEFGSVPTIILVPHLLVKRLLHISDRTWNLILYMTRTFGSLTYVKSGIDSDIVSLPLEQRVFRSFCLKILSGQRFHLLCRHFNRKKVSENSFASSALYAADVKPVSLLMATS